MERPLQRLDDFRVVSVPGRERHYRVAGVGRVMLQILALQHELGEPLDLNGDTFEELVDQAISAVKVEAVGALYGMFLMTNPRILRHKKYWSPEAFNKDAPGFAKLHSRRDPTYHPATYRRSLPQENRRPRITVEIPQETEDTLEAPAIEVKTKNYRKKIRPRPEDHDEEPPAPKRQATHQRQLRSHEKKASTEKQAVAPPAGKVVARGKGWYEIESDSDEE